VGIGWVIRQVIAQNINGYKSIGRKPEFVRIAGNNQSLFGIEDGEQNGIV